MRDFRPLSLDTIKLAAGRGLVTLPALAISGHAFMKVRRLTLTLKTN